MTLTGIVHHVGEQQTFKTSKGNDFTKRELVIKTSGEYPQTVPVEVTGKALEHIPDVGQPITAHIDIRGREWTKDGVTKYFPSISCWRIEPLANQEPTDHTNSFKDDVPF